jgi:predicted N-acetyltransferase YhbS
MVGRNDLFVEPSHIGKGLGKRHWDHAIDLARRMGYRTVVLTADPHAEPFYVRQGAVRVGEKPFLVLPGHVLPILDYHLRV